MYNVTYQADIGIRPYSMEGCMAQEAAADQSMPHGSVFRAWLEAFLHPSFATFQR